MGKRPGQFQLMVPFLQAVEQLGIEREPLFSRFERRRKAQVQDGAAGKMDLVLMLEAATELAGDPGFAIRIGETINLLGTGSFGFAMMSSATVRDTLNLMLGYQKVLAPGPHWEAHPQQGGIMVRMNMKRGSGEQLRMATELVHSINIRHGRLLSNTRMAGVEIEVNYPRPCHAGTYLESLSLPLAYDREYSQVWIPESVLAMQLNPPDPAVNALFLQQCEEILNGMEAAESITAKVRQLLVVSTAGFPDSATVAQQMNMSERTLRRRLQGESTSFRAVLDDVRNVLAQRYLAETGLEVIDIAHLVGYSEPENFYRAFVRWNGVTPAQYRRWQG
ncbi:MAG: helix-turn-helix domain-containing protein [Halioglobus sp.]|nr:helix-turn-helix domain-containing protein [Halioglobus sp.]